MRRAGRAAAGSAEPSRRGSSGRLIRRCPASSAKVSGERRACPGEVRKCEHPRSPPPRLATGGPRSARAQVRHARGARAIITRRAPRPRYAAVEVLRTHACIERAARLSARCLLSRPWARSTPHATPSGRGLTPHARRTGLPAGHDLRESTQFNDPADSLRYPKTPTPTCVCAAAGRRALAPDARGHPPTASPPVPDLPVAPTPGLEDRHRPGYAACQVVARLFTITNPAAAVFGEKDWQQLRVIARSPRG